MDAEGLVSRLRRPNCPAGIVLVIHNGNDADDQDTCREWLRKKFLGTATSEESENGVAEGAAFFAELDVAVK